MTLRYMYIILALSPLALTAGNSCFKSQPSIPGVYIKVALLDPKEEILSYDHQNHTHRNGKEQIAKVPVTSSNATYRIALAKVTLNYAAKEAMIGYQLKLGDTLKHQESAPVTFGTSTTVNIENGYSVSLSALYIKDN